MNEELKKWVSNTPEDRRLPECDCFPARLNEICNGTAIVDGNPMNPEHVTFWRAQHGLAPIWDVSQPSRGLGDSIAKITHATGIAQVVHAVTGGGCGCGARQESLNTAFSYGSGS